MKSFFFKIVIFVLGLNILILFLSSFFKLILINNLNVKSDKIKYETLLLGDSQIQNGINDSIIENSINIAEGGDPIFYNYIKLKAIYKLGVKPHILVLGWSPNNFVSKGFYEVPKAKEKISKYFFLMSLMDYNDLIRYNFEGWYKGLIGSIFSSPVKKIFYSKATIKEADIGGFKPLPNNTSKYLENDILDTENEELFNIIKSDKIALKYLEKIIDFSNTNDIEIILISMPNHKSLNEKEKLRKSHFNEHIETLKDKVVYWDYSHYDIKDEYFFDENHLNKNGANAFSDLINKRIKSILKKQ